MVLGHAFYSMANIQVLQFKQVSRVLKLQHCHGDANRLHIDWGDILSITVKNSMTGNGTSVHWHGIRQLNTNTMDGVGGITECPLAPGDTKTYTFHCTQFGSTWYHSHYSAQYGDGAFGTIIINGPASSNYDIDLGTYTINDWYYRTAFQIDAITDVNLQSGNGPPPADTILINGTNKNAAGGGTYGRVSITKGKKYRLRLINTSVDNMIRVSLDNHPFTVMTSDLVPIKPYKTNWVLLAIGQRYDVVIYANQTVGNYWFRAEVATDCASSNNFYGRSIFSYSGAASGDPTSTAATIPSVCKDESPLVPWVPNSVSSSAFVSQVGNLQVDITQEQVTTNGQNIVVWGVNLTAIDVDWEKPTLEYVKTGNTSYPRVFNLIEIPNEGTVSLPINAPNRDRTNAQSVVLLDHPRDSRHSRAHPPSDPSPRPRLLRPRHGLGHLQHQHLPQHADVQQPAAARRRAPARRRLARASVPDRQPGRLAHALPHRVAHQRGPRRAVPREQEHHRPPRRRLGDHLLQLG